MRIETKEQIIKRIKSLAWRVGAMAGIYLLAFFLETVNLWEAPETVRVIVGLVVAEITKYLNTKK